jgi:hypothetical protein
MLLFVELTEFRQVFNTQDCESALVPGAYGPQELFSADKHSDRMA